MSRHAQVRSHRQNVSSLGKLSRQLFVLAALIGSTAVYAAQPLSDQELKHRYLAYSAEDNEVIVVIAQAESAPARTPQLMPRTLRLIDIENTNNLLLWQDRQNLAVGANIGLLDTSRQVLSAQPPANFGSEPFSYRWGGNLDQIVEIARISGFALYGIDVELHNISGNIRIEAQIF